MYAIPTNSFMPIWRGGYRAVRLDRTVFSGNSGAGRVINND